MAVLLDSVAPLVKMISLGSAPIRSATCCSEPKATHQSEFNHITNRETKNHLSASIIQIKSPYLSCSLHCCLTLPAIGMCSGVRVTIVIHLVGQHGIQDTRILLMSAQIKQKD